MTFLSTFYKNKLFLLVLPPDTSRCFSKKPLQIKALCHFIYHKHTVFYASWQTKTNDLYSLRGTFNILHVKIPHIPGPARPVSIWKGDLSNMNARNQEVSHSLYVFDSKPPVSKALPISLQHIMAMFLGTVTVPIVIAGAAGADAATRTITWI